jgi:hypothetical protein
VVKFDLEMTVSGLSSLNLTMEERYSFRQTQATLLKTEVRYVKYDRAYDPNDKDKDKDKEKKQRQHRDRQTESQTERQRERQMRERQMRETERERERESDTESVPRSLSQSISQSISLSGVSGVVVTNIELPLIDYPEYSGNTTLLLSSAIATINDAVSSGNFTETLKSIALTLNVSTFTNLVAEGVTVSNVLIQLPPTYSPTYSPTTLKETLSLLESHGGEGLSDGAIAGVVVGVFVGVGLVLGGIYYFYLMKKSALLVSPSFLPSPSKVSPAPMDVEAGYSATPAKTEAEARQASATKAVVSRSETHEIAL